MIIFVNPSVNPTKKNINSDNLSTTATPFDYIVEHMDLDQQVAVLRTLNPISPLR